MSASDKIIKNTIFLYGRTITSLLLGVFTTRILLEALGESDFGLYNVVGGSITMLGFLSASMSGATQRFLSYAEGKGDSIGIKRYFNNAVAIHRGLSVIMIVVLFVAGIFFFNGVLNIPNGKMLSAIVVYGCLVVTTAFAITIVPYEAEINAHEDMLFFSILGIADVVAKFCVALGVLFMNSDKLIFYALGMGIESFLYRFAAQVYCRVKYKECRKVELRKYIDKATIKEMTSFAGWNLANISTGMISLFGMNIVVNHYFGTNVNAAMGVATQLSGAMMGLSANMLKAVAPVIVKSEGGQQHKRMLQFSYASCKFSYLLFAFVCIPVLFYISPVLGLWLKDVPQWTSTMCICLILATLIEQITFALYHSINAVGHIAKYNIARSISNICAIIISILMFQYGNFKPYWVYVNWGICKGCIGGIINLYYSHKLVDLKYNTYIEKVVVPAAVSSVAVCLVFLLLKYDELSWIINVVIGVLISIPIYFFIALSELEKLKVKSMIPFNLVRRIWK